MKNKTYKAIWLTEELATKVKLLATKKKIIKGSLISTLMPDVEMKKINNPKKKFIN